MRLPESITTIAPIGDILTAQEAGQAELSREVERHCQRLLVETADAQGLSRWEADYALPEWSGTAASARKVRLRGTMAGGQTLTVERLRALTASVIEAEDISVREIYDAYRVEVTTFNADALPTPEDLEALDQVLQRQKPAHLQIDLLGSTNLQIQRQESLWGKMVCILTADINAPVST